MTRRKKDSNVQLAKRLAMALACVVAVFLFAFFLVPVLCGTGDDDAPGRAAPLGDDIHIQRIIVVKDILAGMGADGQVHLSFLVECHNTDSSPWTPEGTLVLLDDMGEPLGTLFLDGAVLAENGSPSEYVLEHSIVQKQFERFSGIASESPGVEVRFEAQGRLEKAKEDIFAQDGTAF